MAENTKYKIRNVIVCDDVRNEVGNKKSLMGVITGDILVRKFPASINIAFFLDIAAPGPEQQFDINLELFVGDERVAGGQIIGVARSGIADVILPRGVIKVESETTIMLMASLHGGERNEIVRKKIMLNPSAGSIAPQPLASQSPSASPEI